MDNQEAQIKVAQEVPFVTGQYTSTGGNNNGNVNPFQTITRQEVGTILKITPQINEGDSVMLKIEQESSSIAGTSSGAVDLITNKRTINTNVLIEDGGTIVLGGLIQDTQTSGEQRVPFLGRIPIIGEAFRTRSAQEEQDQPDGLHPAAHPARRHRHRRIETGQKYNYIRDQQRRFGPRGEVLPLLPGEKRQLLPDWPPPRCPATPAPARPPAPAPPPRRNRRARPRARPGRRHRRTGGRARPPAAAPATARQAPGNDRPARFGRRPGRRASRAPPLVRLRQAPWRAGATGRQRRRRMRRAPGGRRRGDRRSAPLHAAAAEARARHRRGVRPAAARGLRGRLRRDLGGGRPRRDHRPGADGAGPARAGRPAREHRRRADHPADQRGADARP